MKHLYALFKAACYDRLDARAAVLDNPDKRRIKNIVSHNDRVAAERFFVVFDRVLDGAELVLLAYEPDHIAARLLVGSKPDADLVAELVAVDAALFNNLGVGQLI